MGTVQILTKCCNDDDLEIDNDDDEKPKVKQQPILTTDKKDKLISPTDSFNTTIPCFTK